MKNYKTMEETIGKTHLAEAPETGKPMPQNIPLAIGEKCLGFLWKNQKLNEDKEREKEETLSPAPHSVEEKEIEKERGSRAEYYRARVFRFSLIHFQDGKTGGLGPQAAGEEQLYRAACTARTVLPRSGFFGPPPGPGKTARRRLADARQGSLFAHTSKNLCAECITSTTAGCSLARKNGKNGEFFLAFCQIIRTFAPRKCVRQKKHSSFKDVWTMHKYRLSLLLVLSLSALLGHARRMKMPSLKDKTPYSVAHRGCHIEHLVMENCPEGVKYARKYGFRAIECDAHYTKDSVLVIMHDAQINRTMRLRDGYTYIPEPVRYADLTYQELCEKYVLVSTDPSLRTPIPTLEAELLECKRQGIVPMLHTPEYGAYEMAQRIVGDNWVAFDAHYEAVKRARELGNCLILWDPDWRSAEEVMSMLEAIGGPCGVSTMKPHLLTADFCHALTSHGYQVQSSIFPTPYEMQVVQNGATIMLSDFCLFDYAKKGKKTGEFKKADEKLQTGDSIRYECPRAEDASIQFEMEFEGKMEIVVDGTRKYEIEGEPGKVWRDGWRHHHEEHPSIVLRALAPTKIKNLNVTSRKY